MRFFNQIFIKFLLLSMLVALNSCGEPESSEMTKGHRQAIKEQCKNDPDKKLCGKEVRIKFKKDGHKYVSFKELSKGEINRVAINCKPEKKYGLVAYNDCLYKNKELALGNNITPKEDRPKSNIDELKQYVYRIIAHDNAEEKGARGSGVAIAKNLIATNCHVVLNDELTKKRNKDTYYDIIRVINLQDENKRGTVTLYKKGYEKDLDICILKTKSDLKYVKKRIPYKRLKQSNKVRAIGNPIGIVGLVTDGKITALKTWSSGSLGSAIEDGKAIQFKIPWKIIHHDAAIGSGSSGGPLFDAGGNLIGLNTIGFMEKTTGAFSVAVSADHINDVLRD